MTGEVNRVPSGLLGYLDMKARGSNPRTLSAEVQGDVDVDRWYYAQLRLVINASLILAGTGFSAYFTVPNGQYWWVRGASLWTIALAAGTTVAGMPTALLRADTANPGLFPLTPSQSFTTPSRFVVGTTELDLILRPNDQMGVLLTSLVVGTNPAIVLSVDYAPIII